ncbi:MAG: alginate lyase family protein [Clostridia bacterium]|nr:alginate lyase family protein [Clostridia bacterium]
MNYSNVPNTVSFDGKKLSDIKERLALYPEEVKIITDRADKLLETEPFTVVKKELIPESKDPHDYMTMGTYWWPDPTKPDGLPYIRRDGVFNPKAKDRNTYGAMADGAFNLAHAAYLLEREDYAKKALEFLSVWHLDKETRMNPHAEYAQAIPGICEGRGIGIIDFAHSYNVFDATEILYSLGVMTDEQYNGMQKWYVDFVNWLITSEKGIFEDNYFNNHGAWYDVQILSAAIFTKRPELARRVAMNAYRRRHQTHIMADGSQPHELARTQAMSYSTMNLMALVRLAKYGTKLGRKEYAEIDTEKGVLLIGKAAEFLYPYAEDQSEFKYQQMHPGDFGASLSFILKSITEITGDEKYADMAKKFNKPKNLTNIIPV